MRSPEAKRPLGRPKCKWEDNIKMDLKEVVVMLATNWTLSMIGTNGGLM